MKIKEIREMSAEQLAEKLVELKKVKTVQRERELAAK